MEDDLDMRRMLAESAADFVRNTPVGTVVRAWRKKPDGYDEARWREMTELGWVGLLAPEDEGGSGLGLADAAALLMEVGRGVGPEPLSAIAVLAMRALGACDSAQAREWMSAIAGGAPVCVAWQEKAGDMAAQDCAARAEKTADGWRLSGVKDYAHGAGRAQAFLVSARAIDGVGLFIVKADAAGLSRETRYFTDGTTCDRITLRDVVAEACVGAPGAGETALDAALEETRIAVSAEMLGCARAAFDMTVEYLKTRKQFGKAIGSFQALQHRAVDLYVTQEIMRSAVDRAVRAFPEAQDARERALIASACKARCSDGALQIAKEAIQMHGAIGYTDEHDIGLFVRRALVLSAWLGNSAQHRKRYAALSPSLDLV